MSAVLPPDCAPRTSRGDRGFTLIELMIAIVLSLMIGGVVVAALITSLNAARSTSAQMSDSTDAGLVSSFLVRDAQSAGGIDPGTAMRDPTLGVSNLASPADWGGCAQSGVFVLRFSWMDRTAAATSVVTYAGVPDPLDGTKQQLIRRLCTNGTQADVVLGRDINVNPLSTFATCQNPDLSSGCGSQSTSVTLTLTGKNVPTPLVSVLTASLRSTASQLTIIGPPSLPGGQVGASYASVFLTTIGGSTVTAAGASVDPKWAAIGLPNGLSIAPSTDKSAGVISGTPIAGAVGHYTVTITVTDALGAKASKVYTIDVHAPPVAGVEVYSTPEDVTLTVPAPGVLANDTSPENKPLTAILYSGVANGSLTFASNGGFTYTPRPNFNGADSFKYKANDGSLSSSIVTVALTVSAVNDPPVNRVPVGQETPKNTNEVFAGSAFISITDVDAGVLPVKVQLNATNGTVALPAKTGLTFSVGNGTAAATMTFTGTIANINLSLVGATFAPTSNFVGPASLQIVTNDQGNTGSGGALSKTDAVTINVTSLGIFTASQDVGNVKLTGSSSSASSTAYTVSGSGKDIWENNFDGFQFIYRPMTGDGSLTARIASEDVTYNGVHNPTLLCWAADNSHQQPCISVSKSEVMFRQDLTNVSAMHASVGMTQGNGSEYIYRTTVGASTGAASPGDSLNFPYWVRLTRRGDQLTAEISPDGVNWTQRGTTQTIALGSTVYVGLASSAVYQLDTSTNQSTKRNTTQFDNVSISTPPTAVADAYFVNEDTTLTVPAVSGVLFNDSDAEGSILTTDLVTGTTGLTLNPDGSFTYVPPANFSGTASFTYAADDGVLNSPPATVTITVNSSNETPSFSKGADQIIGSNLGPQITAGWATAISQGTGETDQLVDFIVTNTNNSLFSVQPAVSTDGTLSYTSAADATGTATVSVSIHDNGGTSNGAADTSAVQTFTITIDDPPVVTATATSLAYIENATTALDPGVTVTDSDNATVASATVTMTANYVNGQDTLAFVNQNGITGTWTPATGVLALSGTSSVANYQAALRSITYFNNSDSPATATRTVTFQANDGLLPSNLASRTITITAVNDPPVAAADSYSVNEDTTLTVPVNTGVLANDTDVDGNPLTAVLVSGTSVTLNSNGSFTYVPPANFNGTASFSYKANDGSSDSNVVTVTLTVVAVNDVPSFAKGASQSVPMNGSGATVAGWATSISQGTGDTGQVVNFIVTNNNNPIFSVQPAVSATGTLTYTPAVNAAGVATVSVSIHDNGGTANGGVDTSAVQTFTITITDTVGPTGGSVDAGSLVGTGTRYSTSTTLSLVLNKGADPSGLATTGAVLDRATATLTSGGTADGVCGSYGSFALVTGGTDPVSPKSDSVPASGCYKYQYIVKDTVGNSTTYTSPDIKVDTSVPTTPSLVFSAFTKAYWSGSGTTVFYNSSTGISGSFTATATATDTTSGILSYAWPALGTGWTSTPGALGVNTYSWTPVPTAPATKTVTATNNASSTSLTSPFTLTGDAVIPTGGAVSYLNGSQTSTTILVTFGSSTDAASGIATRLLQRASATLTGTTCGTYSSFSTVVNGTNPAGTTLTDTVAHGNCYKYQYVVTDNVGNVDSNTSVNVTKNS